MGQKTPIDYTKMRKGKRLDGGQIGPCPKCGRKGLIKEVRFKRAGHIEITHRGELEIIESHRGAFGIFSAEDSCSVAIPPEEFELG